MNDAHKTPRTTHYKGTQTVFSATGEVLFSGDWNPKIIAQTLSTEGKAFWKGKRVLDIGANTCGLSLELARMGAQVCATEPVEFRRNLARDLIEECAHKEGLSLEIVGKKLFECKELGKFDVVLFLGLIYHLRYPQFALDYLSTLQAEYLFISAQTVDASLLVLMNRKGLPHSFQYPDHVVLAGYSPSHSMLRAMLQHAGFKNITLLNDREYNLPNIPPGLTNTAYYCAAFGKSVDPYAMLDNYS